jgi:hypothetical protein
MILAGESRGSKAESGSDSRSFLKTVKAQYVVWKWQEEKEEEEGQVFLKKNKKGSRSNQPSQARNNNSTCFGNNGGWQHRRNSWRVLSVSHFSFSASVESFKGEWGADK